MQTSTVWGGARQCLNTIVPPLLHHSGFALFDRPVWTNFVGEKFRQRNFFLVRAKQKKMKTVNEPPIPPKNYRWVNVD